MGDPVELFGGRRPTLLIRTVKVSAAVGLVTFLGAHLATNGFERGTTTRLAGVIRGAPDPETTGSITTSARRTRLDPCVVLRP